MQKSTTLATAISVPTSFSRRFSRSSLSTRFVSICTSLVTVILRVGRFSPDSVTWSTIPSGAATLNAAKLMYLVEKVEVEGTEEALNFSLNIHFQPKHSFLRQHRWAFGW
jgi:hypothetical protein